MRSPSDNPALWALLGLLMMLGVAKAAHDVGYRAGYIASPPESFDAPLTPTEESDRAKTCEVIISQISDLLAREAQADAEARHEAAGPDPRN